MHTKQTLFDLVNVESHVMPPASVTSAEMVKHLLSVLHGASGVKLQACLR